MKLNWLTTLLALWVLLALCQGALTQEEAEPMEHAVEDTQQESARWVPSSEAVKEVTEAVDKFAERASTHYQATKEATTAAANNAKASFHAASTRAQDAVKTNADRIRSTVTSYTTDTKTSFLLTMSGVCACVRDFFTRMTDALLSATSGIRSCVSRAAANVCATVKSTYSRISNSVTSSVSGVINVMANATAGVRASCKAITAPICNVIQVMVSAVSSRMSSLCVCFSTTLRTVSAYAARIAEVVKSRGRACRDAIIAMIPEAARPLLRNLIDGAASVVVVGRGFSASAAAEDGAAGVVPVGAHATGKFVYSAGAIAAEFALLQALYKEPHRNRRNNKINRKLSTPLGWALLVALIAIPNGVVVLDVLIIMTLKLSPPVFAPAIVIGQLARPYVVAAFRACLCLRRLYTAYVARFVKPGGTGSCCMCIAEVGLWIAVLGAAMFLVAARTTPEPYLEDAEVDSESEVDEKPTRKSTERRKGTSSRKSK